MLESQQAPETVLVNQEPGDELIYSEDEEERDYQDSEVDDVDEDDEDYHEDDVDEEEEKEETDDGDDHEDDEDDQENEKMNRTINYNTICDPILQKGVLGKKVYFV